MKVAVLCGGISTEREISIVSGIGVCRALRAKGHNAILLDVFFGDENADLMNAFHDDYDIDLAAEYIHSMDGDVESAVANPNRTFFGPNIGTLCKMADIVFLALHGENGENGKLQAAFDLQRIRYTGTGYLGSALSMDKGLAKIVLKAAGVPVPAGFTMRKDQCEQDPLEKGLGFPIVVKVCCGGSSVGVYITNNMEEYRSAVDAAFELEEEIVVEQYIKGREFSVGVIEGKALPIIEIAPIEGFYDYKNKYTAGSTIETCPADLSEETAVRMKAYAELGYRALYLDGYGRLDFLMDEVGNMYCLEANTLPGMTPTSLLPQEAAALGMDFPTLCEKLIQSSLKKYI